MVRHPEYVMCYAGVDEVTEEGAFLRDVIPTYQSGYIFPELLRQFDLNIVTPLLRTAFLRDNQLNFDPTVVASEEYNLFMRMAARGPIGVIPKVLGRTRVRQGSLTEKAIGRWAKERFYTLDQINQSLPDLRGKFPAEMAEAYARGSYYQARFCFSENDVTEARRMMASIRGVDRKYFLLWILSMLPRFVWDLVHSPGFKRGLAAKLAVLWRGK